jgi:hypothetical protein
MCLQNNLRGGEGKILLCLAASHKVVALLL